MSFRTVSVVFQIQDPKILPPTPRLVLLALAFCCVDDADGQCSQRVSAKTLALRTGLSYSTTRLALKFLLENNLISSDRRKTRTGADASSWFTINTDYLSTLCGDPSTPPNNPKGNDPEKIPTPLPNTEGVSATQPEQINNQEVPPQGTQETERGASTRQVGEEKCRLPALRDIKKVPITGTHAHIESAVYRQVPPEKVPITGTPLYLSLDLSRGDVETLDTTRAQGPVLGYPPKIETELQKPKTPWSAKRINFYNLISVFKTHCHGVLGLGGFSDPEAPHGFRLPEKLEAECRALLAEYYRQMHLASHEQLMDHLKDLALYIAGRKAYYLQKNDTGVSLQTLCSKKTWFYEWMAAARAKKETVIYEQEQEIKPLVETKKHVTAEDLAEMVDTIKEQKEKGIDTTFLETVVLKDMEKEFDESKKKSKNKDEIERIKQIPDKKDRLQSLQNLIENIERKTQK